MKCNILCDYCKKPIIRYPYNIVQIVRRTDNDCVVETLLEKDLHIICSLRIEREINRRTKNYFT